MPSNNWQAELLDWRLRKDAYFGTGRGPVDENYGPLSYYPPDPAWNLRLDVERCEPQPLELATSSGTAQSYQRYGHATLPSGERLLLLSRAGDTTPESLFVPFKDATSEHETYGAGRYLDAPLEGGMVTLDFNRAYQPFCAYSPRYTCPLPPAENWLREAVRAGEKLRGDR